MKDFVQQEEERCAGFALCTSMKKREAPRSSASPMRMLVITRRLESDSDAAQTGAPAWAKTAATPMDRSMVLLPDMFEPVTMSAGTSASRRTSLATRSVATMSG